MPMPNTQDDRGSIAEIGNLVHSIAIKIREMSEELSRLNELVAAMRGVALCDQGDAEGSTDGD
jgi:hypothetical protein